MPKCGHNLNILTFTPQFCTDEIPVEFATVHTPSNTHSSHTFNAHVHTHTDTHTFTHKHPLTFVDTF